MDLTDRITHAGFCISRGLAPATMVDCRMNDDFLIKGKSQTFSFHHHDVVMTNDNRQVRDSSIRE